MLDLPVFRHLRTTANSSSCTCQTKSCSSSSASTPTTSCPEDSTKFVKLVSAKAWRSSWQPSQLLRVEAAEASLRVSKPFSGWTPESCQQRWSQVSQVLFEFERLYSKNLPKMAEQSNGGEWFWHGCQLSSCLALNSPSFWIRAFPFLPQIWISYVRLQQNSSNIFRCLAGC